MAGKNALRLAALFGLFYAGTVYGASRLVVPYLGFQKAPLPRNIPRSWQKIIDRLNKQAENDFDFLRLAYEYITNRYYGAKLEALAKIYYVFKDIFSIKKGFMPCTGQNMLLRLMLIQSGRFTDDDIRVKIVPLNIAIHQYLEVRVNGQWVRVDPWAKGVGVPFGKRAFLVL